MNDSTFDNSSNRLIARNTLFLYGRMLYSMAVSLITTRLVLKALGVEDYGIYNVVGSVVSMFTFVNMAMGNATSRFITFALGENNKERLKDVFSTSVIIHSAIALLTILLAETIGLWFVYNKMVIPFERFTVAIWCYQLSILSCALSVICVPHNSEIIAHERMGVFAFVQVFSSTVTLGIAYLISITTYDRLLLYAFLLFILQIVTNFFYIIYCRRKFVECHFNWVNDGKLLKKMLSFAGWSLFGNLSFVGYTQGVNILLNIFFGPAVNAARGVANQVQSAIKGFVQSFQTALNPQIIKSYATNDHARMHSLICSSSRLSFYLLLLLILPVFLEAPAILGVWLVEVPDHAVSFIRISLAIMLINVFVNPIGTANNATGNIKRFQIITGCLSLSIVLLSYIFLKLGYEPEVVFFVQFIVSIIVLFVKLFIVARSIKLSVSLYIKTVLGRCLLVTMVSSLFPSVLYVTLTTTFLSFLFVCLSCVICVLSTVLLCGLTNNERDFAINYAKKIFKKSK